MPAADGTRLPQVRYSGTRTGRWWSPRSLVLNNSPNLDAADCGTGTGGLSALFLGRMRITVDQAIEAYLQMGTEGFKRSPVSLVQRWWNQEAIFDGDLVTRVIGDIVLKYVGDREAQLGEEPHNSSRTGPRFCRTAVIATSSSNASDPPYVFRSYRTRLGLASTQAIHDVARATIATAGVFPPISLGYPAIKFIDAGVAGYNNPAETALHEVGRVSLSTKISCLVSLGTGLQNIVSVSDTWDGVIKVSKRLMEDCERVHERLLQRRDAGLPYYRFNVANGLDETGITEWDEETVGKIASITEGYMRKGDVDSSLNSCTSLLIGGVLDNSTPQSGQNSVERPLSLLSSLKTIKDDSLAEKIFAWLKASDSSANYNAACERRQAGTGNWFFDGERFAEWKTRRDSFLCIYGKPGCGKTVLCSSVISHIQHICLKKHSSACAYFFFDGRDAQSIFQHHRGLLCSLIQQFTDKCDGIPVPLVKLYGTGRQNPSMDALEDILLRTLDTFTDAFIIVDSLDESVERGRLLRWIGKITRSKAGNLHVLVTSRPEEEIQDTLQSFELGSIFMENQAVDHDIKTFINFRLKTGRLKKWPESFQALIKEKLMDKVDGMFRWASLQLDELQKCPSQYEVKKQLEGLPKDLDETYHRILLKIPEQCHSGVKVILQWIAFSARALSLEELAEAPTLDLDPENGPKYNSDLKYMDRDVLAACSGLIIESEGYVKLAHFSVKEYLTSERITHGSVRYFSISERLSHSLIANTCLAYLFRFDSLAPLNFEELSGFPLAMYTAKHWDFHVRLGSNEKDPMTQDLILMLFNSNTALTNWVRLWDLDDPSQGQQRNLQFEDISHPVYYTSHLNLPDTSIMLLKNRSKAYVGSRENVNKIGVHGSALIEASLHGYEEVVKLLLNCGANIAQEEGSFGTALIAASWNGHLKVIKLLIDCGANIAQEAGSFGTALIAASEHGHPEVIKLLLDYGTNISQKGRNSGSALIAASFHGHLEIVKLLLDYGASIAQEEEEYGTPLIAASLYGHIEVAKLLIDCGANIAQEGGHFGTALIAASFKGHLAVVKLLIYYGANIMQESGHYGTALIAGSLGGHLDIVKLLIQCGANVSQEAGHYGTALIAASFRGHLEVVDLLICCGADVTQMAGHYGTALVAASSSDHVEVIELLINCGAIVALETED